MLQSEARRAPARGCRPGGHRRRPRLRFTTRLAEKLVILVVLAALAGALVLVFLNSLWGIESRAHWSRERGIRRSQRLERRVFVIGVGLVLAMVALGVVFQLARRPSCTGNIVITTGPDGAPLECVCEQGRRGACFPPGP